MKPLLLFLLAGSLHAAFIPDGKLKADDYTVLMAVDAKLSAGLVPFQPGGHGKFFVQGWQRPDQAAAWTVRADAAAEYVVQVLIHRCQGPELRLEVAAAGRTLTTTLPADSSRWQRLVLPVPISLPQGESTVTLRIAAAAGDAAFSAEVHAVELIRPEVQRTLEQRALAMRADTTWFQQARYGIMVHWTKQTMPRSGEPKSYDQAVAGFDVEGFAGQMQETGAGLVVFTTSHAYQYFPAPLASLERIIPGRTSKRDLVAELAAALGKRGIRLMLYFHLGARDDAEWLQASGFWDSDTSRFFANWQSVITEAGERYRERLAGWWFDDGSTNYYYRSAPWEALNRAAKAGHPQRLVGFNAWELNNPTAFHDFFTGEGFQDPRGSEGLLVRGGSGRYPAGTHRGLQASACLITESEWLHRGRDRPLNPPKWTAAQLAPLLNEFAAHRNVPVFNLEIYQEGVVSPRSVELFREARKLAADMR